MTNVAKNQNNRNEAKKAIEDDYSEIDDNKYIDYSDNDKRSDNEPSEQSDDSEMKGQNVSFFKAVLGTRMALKNLTVSNRTPRLSSSSRTRPVIRSGSAPRAFVYLQQINRSYVDRGTTMN